MPKHTPLSGEQAEPDVNETNRFCKTPPKAITWSSRRNEVAPTCDDASRQANAAEKRGATMQSGDIQTWAVTLGRLNGPCVTDRRRLGAQQTHLAQWQPCRARSRA